MWDKVLELSQLSWHRFRTHSITSQDHRKRDAIISRCGFALGIMPEDWHRGHQVMPCIWIRYMSLLELSLRLVQHWLRTPALYYSCKYHLFGVISNEGGEIIDNSTVLRIRTSANDRCYHGWAERPENGWKSHVKQLFLESTEVRVIVWFTIIYDQQSVLTHQRVAYQTYFWVLEEI